MLRHSRRFGGPIGQLALAVNAGDAMRAEAVLRGGGEAPRCAGSSTRTSTTWCSWRWTATALSGAARARAGRAHEDWVRAVLQRFEAFRILCAVREGEWGVEGLNDGDRAAPRAAGPDPPRGEWYVGRPVMVTRNDYGTGVFNGDIGLTLADPARPGSLRVYFLEGDKVRSVLATRLRTSRRRSR
jgi:exodeoxyribonuclease V alpha subunit